VRGRCLYVCICVCVYVYICVHIKNLLATLCSRSRCVFWRHADALWRHADALWRHAEALWRHADAQGKGERWCLPRYWWRRCARKLTAPSAFAPSAFAVSFRAPSAFAVRLIPPPCAGESVRNSLPGREPGREGGREGGRDGRREGGREGAHTRPHGRAPRPQSGAAQSGACCAGTRCGRGATAARSPQLAPRHAPPGAPRRRPRRHPPLALPYAAQSQPLPPFPFRCESRGSWASHHQRTAHLKRRSRGRPAAQRAAE